MFINFNFLTQGIATFFVLFKIKRHLIYLPLYYFIAFGMNVLPACLSVYCIQGTLQRPEEGIGTLGTGLQI